MEHRNVEETKILNVEGGQEANFQNFVDSSNSNSLNLKSQHNSLSSCRFQELKVQTDSEKTEQEGHNQIFGQDAQLISTERTESPIASKNVLAFALISKELNNSHTIPNPQPLLAPSAKQAALNQLGSVKAEPFGVNTSQYLQSVAQNHHIPPYVNSSHDYSNSTSQVVDEPLFEETEEQEEEAENTAKHPKPVDSCESGRFQMYNHQISHSKYRTIYQGLDNETGCEIAWSCYLLSKQDTFKKEELLKTLQKVCSITSQDPPDRRAKHILRVIYIEVRPNKNTYTNLQLQRDRRLSMMAQDRRSGRQLNNLSGALSVNRSEYIDDEQEELIVVTELITAGSIREYLRKIHTPRLKVIKEWCMKILEAVSFLHEHDIVHGKITCESVYINSNNGEIKIGDIGIKHVYAQAQIHEDGQIKQFFKEQATMKYDVLCIGMALLEMILTAEVHQHAFKSLCKVVNRQAQQKILDNILDEQLRDFISKAMNDSPEIRATCQELRQHPFMQIQNEDKDKDVIKLHTLGTLIRSLHRQNSKLTTTPTVESLETNSQMQEQSTTDQPQLRHKQEEVKKSNDLSKSDDKNSSEVLSNLKEMKKFDLNDASNEQKNHFHLPKNRAGNRGSNKKKIVLIKKTKSYTQPPINEEISERTGSSGVWPVHTPGSSKSNIKNKDLRETIVAKELIQIKEQLEEHTFLSEKNKPEIMAKEIQENNLPEASNCNSLKQPAQDSLITAENSVGKITQVIDPDIGEDDQVLQFIIDVKEKDKFFTVTFPYDLQRDNPDAIAEEMQQDLNLNVKHIEFIKNRLGKVIAKLLKKREKTKRKQDKAQKRAIKAELKIEQPSVFQPLSDIRPAESCNQTPNFEASKLGFNSNLELKNQRINRYSRQSSSLREELRLPPEHRKSDERFEDNQNENILSIRPEQYSNISNRSPTNPKMIDITKSDMDEEVKDVDYNEVQTQQGTQIENKAVIQQSRVELMQSHNNTTGEMHEAMIQHQQENGPIGCQNVVANQCFLNSQSYVDQELQQFMHNSDEEKKQEAKLQAEKERERDKSNQQRNQKKARDEEIAFQAIINEMNILEAMFPNYAREYHEKQREHIQNCQIEVADVNSFQTQHPIQSANVGSPKQNTTNDIFLNLSFESKDHRFNNFHVAKDSRDASEVKDFNELPSTNEGLEEIPTFNELSEIITLENDLDLFTHEESKTHPICNHLLQLQKSRMELRNQKPQPQEKRQVHTTQSYFCDGLGFSSIFDQSNNNQTQNRPELTSKKSDMIKPQSNILLQNHHTLNTILSEKKLQYTHQSLNKETNEHSDQPNETQHLDSVTIPSKVLDLRNQTSSNGNDNTLKTQGNNTTTEIKARFPKLSIHVQELNESNQAKVDSIFNKFEEVFSSEMESERLEAKFKKMKKSDIIKVRVALTIIMPTLKQTNSQDDVTSVLSASLSNYSEQNGTTSLMLNKPTSSLFCKNTRRIVKRFKKKNGMIADSIVDKETWQKVMMAAKDLLPSIINEQANQLAAQSVKRSEQNEALLTTLKAFDDEFELQFDLHNSKSPLPRRRQSIGNRSLQYQQQKTFQFSSLPLSSLPRDQEDMSPQSKITTVKELTNLNSRFRPIQAVDEASEQFSDEEQKAAPKRLKSNRDFQKPIGINLIQFASSQTVRHLTNNPIYTIESNSSLSPGNKPPDQMYLMVPDLKKTELSACMEIQADYSDHLQSLQSDDHFRVENFSIRDTMFKDLSALSQCDMFKNAQQEMMPEDFQNSSF